jgi:hypothetical protein
MSASDAMCRTFRHCCHKVGKFSVILMPVYFASTFVLMGSVALSGAGSAIPLLMALAMACSMLVTTFMLLAQSRHEKARVVGRASAMPLSLLRSGSLTLQCTVDRIKPNDRACRQEHPALATAPRTRITRRVSKSSVLSMQSDVSYNRLRKTLFNRGRC